MSFSAAPTLKTPGASTCEDVLETAPLLGASDLRELALIDRSIGLGRMERPVRPIGSLRRVPQTTALPDLPTATA